MEGDSDARQRGVEEDCEFGAKERV